MQLSRLSGGALFLAFALVLAATPTHADGATSGCAHLSISGVGEGVGVYVDEIVGGVLLSVASGIPQDGITLQLLIAPVQCIGSGIGDLPPVGPIQPVVWETVPDVPVLP